jgi:hypothetical protein
MTEANGMITWQEFFSLVALVILFIAMLAAARLAWGWI